MPYDDARKEDRANMVSYLVSRLTGSQGYHLFQDQQCGSCRSLTRWYRSLPTYQNNSIVIEMPLDPGTYEKRPMLRRRGKITVRETYRQKRSITITPARTGRQTFNQIMAAIDELRRRN